MQILVYLLAAYGIVYALQQKLPFIRYWRLGDLWECPFCLGFWGGWLLWGLSRFLGSTVFCFGFGFISSLMSGLVWALATAATCVALEGLARRGIE